MKKIKFLIGLVLIGLIVVNIHIFVSSIKLSNDINKFEAQISALHKENIELEKNLYQVDSYQYATSMSAALNFTKVSQPLYIDNIKYAYNKGL